MTMDNNDKNIEFSDTFAHVRNAIIRWAEQRLLQTLLRLL